jgi:Thioredoxin-like
MSGERVFSVILSGVLLASVSLNIVQGRLLRARSAEVSGSLEAGIDLPAMKVKDLVGHDVLIGYVDSPKPTVLYIFTPSCQWCRRNFASIRSLVDQRGQQYRFIGISLANNNLRDYVKKYDFGASAWYADPDEDSRVRYRLFSTPTTLVISPSGKLVSVWTGAYVGQTKSEIEHFFSVQIPDAGQS